MAKIMIVEDETTIRELISEELQKWQFETIGTTDFNDVLDDFQEENPQLVLMDINLPVYDGYYWCQKKFVKFLKYQLFLFRVVVPIWI